MGPLTLFSTVGRANHSATATVLTQIIVKMFVNWFGLYLCTSLEFSQCFIAVFQCCLDSAILLHVKSGPWREFLLSACYWSLYVRPYHIQVDAACCYGHRRFDSHCISVCIGHPCEPCKNVMLSGGADWWAPKECALDRGCRLAPPDEYDWTTCMRQRLDYYCYTHSMASVPGQLG